MNINPTRHVAEPTVEIIGETAISGGMIDNIVGSLGFACDDDWSPTAATESLVEFAGRLCYMSFGQHRRERLGYFTHILESKHGSVLEHVSISFYVAGVSRSLTHELVRHRVGVAFSQLSQRYVDHSEARVVIPPTLLRPGREFDLAVWIEDADAQRARYVSQKESAIRSGLDRKDAHGEARSVLTEATETRLVATFNARAFRHFLARRGSLAAEPEIRRLAVAMNAKARKRWPLILSDVEECNDPAKGPYLAVKFDGA